MVGGKVDGQILFGARSEKPKKLFDAGVRNRKIYLVPNDRYKEICLAVNGLIVNGSGLSLQHPSGSELFS